MVLHACWEEHPSTSWERSANAHHGVRHIPTPDRRSINSLGTTGDNTDGRAPSQHVMLRRPNTTPPLGTPTTS
eukprot:6142271-Pyramimonas_sp.AAC.1